MTPKEYLEEVKRTMGNGNGFAWTLGLVGEAGEVADLVKKQNFHGGKDSKGEITSRRMLEECGDVLWYLTAFLHEIHFTLDECMEANVRKLRKRHPNGFTFETAQLHLDEKEYVPPNPPLIPF